MQEWPNVLTTFERALPETIDNYLMLLYHELTQDKLYPVEVVERNGSQVKIHYIGYDNSTDEWRELTDLVHSTNSGDTNNSNTTNNSSNNIDNTIIQPYSLYNELQIKLNKP